MTAPYSVAFHADKDDLIDGRPPAQLTYAALKDAGGAEYERVDLVGGPGSRWARRHLYRIGDDSKVPPEVAAFTIWIDTPRSRWWLTWSRDPHRAGRLLIHSLVPEPGN